MTASRKAAQQAEAIRQMATGRFMPAPDSPAISISAPVAAKITLAATSGRQATKQPPVRPVVDFGMGVTEARHREWRIGYQMALHPNLTREQAAAMVDRSEARKAIR